MEPSGSTQSNPLSLAANQLQTIMMISTQVRPVASIVAVITKAHKAVFKYFKPFTLNLMGASKKDLGEDKELIKAIFKNNPDLLEHQTNVLSLCNELEELLKSNFALSFKDNILEAKAKVLDFKWLYRSLKEIENEKIARKNIAKFQKLLVKTYTPFFCDNDNGEARRLREFVSLVEPLDNPDKALRPQLHVNSLIALQMCYSYNIEERAEDINFSGDRLVLEVVDGCENPQIKAKFYKQLAYEKSILGVN